MMAVWVYRVLYGVLALTSATAVVVNQELTLYNAIFSGYSTDVRPRRLASDPVSVKVRFELNHLTSLDESDQILRSVGVFIASWTDDHLTWDKDVYGLDHIIVPITSVWKPDFVVRNSVGVMYDDVYYTYFRALLQYDGTVTWSFGGNLDTSCELDMTYFPFDKQMCNITLENWIYTNDQVELKAWKDEVEVEDFHNNGQWAYDHSKVEEGLFFHKAFPTTSYPRVTFNLFLTRKSNYMLIHIVVPCLFMMALALSMFWLPPDSGEKVSLGITVLLAFSVFQLIVADNTPKTSDYSPVLTLFLTFVMALCALSTFVAIIVLYFHHHVGSKPVPKCARIFFFNFLSKILCMHSTTPEKGVAPQKDDDTLKLVETSDDMGKKTTPQGNTDSDDLKEISGNLKYICSIIQEEEAGESIMEEWKALARVVDRFCFWVCFIVLTIVALALLCQQDTAH